VPKKAAMEHGTPDEELSIVLFYYLPERSDSSNQERRTKHEERFSRPILIPLFMAFSSFPGQAFRKSGYIPCLAGHPARRISFKINLFFLIRRNKD